ncbi:probable thimet oligopeptidase [Chenopodium quinoa]|uniref:probable thimet oligopeptidase n=1 Tax=Chenopodium quinoa TaxID=63459 RepID=UPI000B770C0E|nr:probable thimet oligopeptidase [Chenopodium quinoa]
MDGEDDRHSQTEKSLRRCNNGGKQNKIIVLTGTAAVLAVALNFAFHAFKSFNHRRKAKDLIGSNVRVNLSVIEIRKLADRIIAESKAVYDSLASVPVDKVRYQDIMVLAELEARHFPSVQSCVFPRLVSTSEDVRKASAEAEQKINTHNGSCRKREDVYSVVKAFAARGEWNNAEAKSYVQSLVRDFEQNGLNLTSSKKEEVQRLQVQIDDLSMQYVQNINDDCTLLLFTESELEGLPSELLQIFDKADDDKFKVTMKSNHVLPILELCKIGATRRKVAVGYGQRCKEINVPVLENLVQLRHKFARLLGYDNYAEYAVGSRMAKTSSKVFEFLEDLSTSLSDLATKELDILKKLKEKEEGDNPFGIEDMLYYVKKFEEENFHLDFGALKEYFPISLVLQGIFKILQDAFGLRFEEIFGAEVWHEDIRVFSVFDLSSCELMGYAYLDLYSREGKYSQTCVLPLQNGSLSANAARQVPVVLLMSELSKEDDNSPTLLRFSEVVSLFHEFGHVVHHICNRSPLARFSGLRVDNDFVEMPGHLLENWCYESNILKLISGYYQDITRQIKDDISMSLQRWRHSFAALKLRQEILYCLFDQIIHSTDNVDFLELFKFLHPKVMLGLPILEGTNPASCFPHSAIGYEASCYSRIWSKVFAADIFTSKFHDGLNHHTGMQFRNKVLAPGGAKDPHECLTNFIGREPSIQAFVDSISYSSI